MNFANDRERSRKWISKIQTTVNPITKPIIKPRATLNASSNQEANTLPAPLRIRRTVAATHLAMGLNFITTLGEKFQVKR